MARPRTEIPTQIGRLLEAVEVLDDAAFRVANIAQAHVEGDEPLGRLVTVEAVAITNRVRRLNGGSQLTIVAAGIDGWFGYGSSDPPLSRGGEALAKLEGLAMGWGRR